MLKDEINWSILLLLQQNARFTNAEIGRRVGLSSPAVAERIKKMEDLGVIKGYSANIDHNATGHQLKAIITLKVFSGRLKPFLETVKKYEEVINCYRITGVENIIMEVLLFDQQHLEDFIDRVIQYGETRTHIVLSNVVENREIRKTPRKRT
ncbi:Lrp/AsnC family transcriptional regulator, leucine-responsive regulatory protein [Pustulibacterium marinum]|uniref:Lrp/AsnC family transcriptional regulator, leucine-responsive regulatory protein n=1 Tax=Pustulibacterium marinum TaxID=1224947 RepID=A0A1I7FCG8_9FLAO|nr:Lrp/AsnC family transcriptional regulator [Pustulibacterium marinum]SFU33953.1 Lrp/AsnC family transcriptional regulator, leucine-responsive regulatory protein [Pustulibacterium marinum]